MRAKNGTAEKLINKAQQLNLEVVRGYFGTSTYCAGLRVSDAAHAFKLGALLGNDFGPVIFDARLATLAFPQASVQA